MPIHPSRRVSCTPFHKDDLDRQSVSPSSQKPTNIQSRVRLSIPSGETLRMGITNSMTNLSSRIGSTLGRLPLVDRLNHGFAILKFLPGGDRGFNQSSRIRFIVPQDQ